LNDPLLLPEKYLEEGSSKISKIPILQSFKLRTLKHGNIVHFRKHKKGLNIAIVGKITGFEANKYKKKTSIIEENKNINVIKIDSALCKFLERIKLNELVSIPKSHDLKKVKGFKQYSQIELTKVITSKKNSSKKGVMSKLYGPAVPLNQSLLICIKSATGKIFRIERDRAKKIIDRFDAWDYTSKTEWRLQQKNLEPKTKIGPELPKGFKKTNGSEYQKTSAYNMKLLGVEKKEEIWSPYLKHASGEFILPYKTKDDVLYNVRKYYEDAKPKNRLITTAIAKRLVRRFDDWELIDWEFPNIDAIKEPKPKNTTRRSKNNRKDSNGGRHIAWYWRWKQNIFKMFKKEELQVELTPSDIKKRKVKYDKNRLQNANVQSKTDKKAAVSLKKKKINLLKYKVEEALEKFNKFKEGLFNRRKVSKKLKTDKNVKEKK